MHWSPTGSTQFPWYVEHVVPHLFAQPSVVMSPEPKSMLEISQGNKKNSNVSCFHFLSDSMLKSEDSKKLPAFFNISRVKMRNPLVF